MDLSFLIPSKMRRKVLAYFVEEPEAQVYVRELARELNEAPQLVYRELINMENFGFLFSSKRGNQRVYRLNKKFIYFPVIQKMFLLKKREQDREFEIIKTFKLDELVSDIKKTPVPEELIPDLTAKRIKPRSYDEAKILEKTRDDK